MEGRHAYCITAAILLAGGAISISISGATGATRGIGGILGWILIVLGVTFLAGAVPPFSRR